jgi:hypothetical protein
MQATASAIAMLVEVVRIEIAEAGKGWHGRVSLTLHASQRNPRSPGLHAAEQRYLRLKPAAE